MNMLTQESISQMLGRELPEELLIIAKLQSNGQEIDSIATILGSTKEEVEELLESQDFKDVRLLVGVETARIRTGTDSNWNGIEHAALNGLAQRVHLLKDPDQLLKIAAVANKATRRLEAPKEHVLDPASAQARVPLKLTRRFTEKLNGEGNVVERSETQQISVVNGTATTPTFAAINRIFEIKRDPTQPTEEAQNRLTRGDTSRAMMDELDQFMSSLPDEEE